MRKVFKDSKAVADWIMVKNYLFKVTRSLIIAFVLAGMHWSMGIAGAEKSQNFVLNGGFENGKANMPFAWQPNSKDGRCLWTADISHSGKKAIMVVAGEPKAAMWRSKLISCEGLTMIKMSAWMKIDGVVAGEKQWNKATISIRTFDENQRELGHLDLIREEGDIDWTEYKSNMVLPGKTRYIRVGCYLSNCKGRAWFDDIKMAKVQGFIGHKISDKPGMNEVGITCNANNTIGHLPQVNGIYYHARHGKFTGITGAKPSIIRLAPLSDSYGIYKRKPNGLIYYNWWILDKDIKRILDVNAIPFLTLCWIPRDMEEEVAQRDYKNWEKLICTMVKHYSKKYDVSDWYWSFWNEPNAFRERGGKCKWVNWDGSENDFFEFYRLTVRAALKANTNIKIGGCGFGSGSWLKRFIGRCGQCNVRVDFLSWHRYGGVPSAFFDDIRGKRNLLAAYPHLKKTELLIDEWSSSGGYKPEDFYLKRSNYAAAYRVAAIYYMLKAGLDQNIWFNAQEAPFGIEVEGVKQATYNSFRMFGMMERKRIETKMSHDDPYVGAITSRNNDGKVTIMVWYFKHMVDRNPDIEKKIALTVEGLQFRSVTYERYLIDEYHSNGFNNRDKQELEMVDKGEKNIDSSVFNYSVSLMPNSVTLLAISNKSTRLSPPLNFDLDKSQ